MQDLILIESNKTEQYQRLVKLKSRENTRKKSRDIMGENDTNDSKSVASAYRDTIKMQARWTSPDLKTVNVI